MPINKADNKKGKKLKFKRKEIKNQGTRTRTRNMLSNHSGSQRNQSFTMASHHFLGFFGGVGRGVVLCTYMCTEYVQSTEDGVCVFGKGP